MINNQEIELPITSDDMSELTVRDLKARVILMSLTIIGYSSRK